MHAVECVIDVTALTDLESVTKRNTTSHLLVIDMASSTHVRSFRFSECSDLARAS